MSMTDVASTFASLESSIEKEKGPFSLFALFQREDVPDRWDLIASAPWIRPDRDAALGYMVRRIQSEIGQESLTALSRIMLVDPEDPAVVNLSRAMSVEHSPVEVRDSVFFGVPVKHAFIITSRPPKVTVAKK
jgi:hypothetical protein